MCINGIGGLAVSAGEFAVSAGVDGRAIGKGEIYAEMHFYISRRFR